MKRTFFLCHVQIFPIPQNFRNFLFDSMTQPKFNFLAKTTISKVHKSNNFENKSSMNWKCFLCHPDITHFVLILRNFLVPIFNLAKILIFLAKTKPLKVHSSVNSQNKPSMKRNFFLCHSHIFPNVTFFTNFQKVFVPLSY